MSKHRKYYRDAKQHKPKTRNMTARERRSLEWIQRQLGTTAL